jgi:hypothetical protein
MLHIGVVQKSAQKYADNQRDSREDKERKAPFLALGSDGGLLGNGGHVVASFVIRPRDAFLQHRGGAPLGGAPFWSGHSRAGPVAPVSACQSAANLCHSLRQARPGPC